MKKSPDLGHLRVGLSPSLDRRLHFYAVAATASGVSLLALAQPSEAKIIYIKTHQKIGLNGVYGLDLNNDGTKDFIIQEIGSSAGTGSNFLGVKPAYGNAVEGSKSSAAALTKNSPIGPSQGFITSIPSFFGDVMARAWQQPPRVATGGGNTGSSGQWINVTNRYLGLRFQIAGKTHYGWARLSVQVNGLQITAELSGYAYETVANKKIRAGQTSGAAEAEPAQLKVRSTPGAMAEPASEGQGTSLGKLALGANGVAHWRGL